MPKIKVHRWRSAVYTIYKDDVRDPECATYHVYGREVCPTTKRKHLQGYIRFTNAKSKSAIQALLGVPGCHLEPRKGTEREASDYCKKDGDYFERGECQDAAPGKRTDLESARAHLGGSSPSVGELIDLGYNYQVLRYAEKYLVYRGPARDPNADPPNIRWYYGETGTGKSRTAGLEAAECADLVYRCTGPAAKGSRWWWDGYDGHRSVIIDDFRPTWCGLSFLLNLLDRYGMRVEAKGGSRQFLAKNIWVTSPKHPETYFHEAGEDLEQLLRRITIIKEFT